MKMKCYSVDVVVTTTYSVEVEANTCEEAEERALNLEYDCMKQVDERVEVNAQSVLPEKE